jgi:hypothetical protein
MKYIGKKFNIPYAGGWSKFSASSPKDGKGSLDNLAWDWLNLYLYEFNFAKENICFSIVLQSDTGMWDSGVDYLEVEKFEKISKSKTKLLFAFTKDYNNCWDMDKLLDYENLKNKYTNSFEITENGKDKMYCMIFDINDFRNKTKTDASLNKFIKYLNKNKIFDINIVDENL